MLWYVVIVCHGYIIAIAINDQNKSHTDTHEHDNNAYYHIYDERSNDSEWW